ncbi:MAG: WD40/YVTN/BNR-like repeat-containing protein [Nitrospinota bacterium]
MKVKKRFKGVLITLKFLVLTAFVFLCFPSFLLAQGDLVFTNLGLYGGRIYDIAIDYSEPNKIFAGTYMGDGLYMTANGGEKWLAVETGGKIRKEDEFKNHTVWAVKIAPDNPGVIWVAHDYWAEKSTDGGVTWTHITNSAMQQSEFRYCRSLAIHPSDSQTVYVGTGGPDSTDSSGAIYKTVDGGAEWRKIKDVDFPVVDIAVDPQNKDIIWAVTNSFGWDGTLYQSKDGGDTWSVIPSLPSYGYLTVAVKPNDSNTVFTGSVSGIIKCVFNGVTCNDSPSLPIPESLLVADISFDPQDHNTLYATWLRPVSWGGDGIGKVARSTDGGDTWEIYPHDYNFNLLTIHPANSEVIIAGDNTKGIFKSDDHGQTWTPISKGVNAVIVYDVAIDPNDSNHILAGTFAGLFEKKDKKPWSLLLKEVTRSVLFHPTNSQIFFAGLEGYLAKKTLDSGQNWTYSNLLGSVNNHVSAIAIDSTNTDMIFIAVDGNPGKIYKSTNQGELFNDVLDGVNQSGENYYPFNVVTIDPSDNQHIFAGGGGFFAPKVLGDLWESIDGGDNWARTGLRNEIVNALLIDPEDTNIIYAGVGYSGGTNVPLYKSIDKGITWTPSYDGIPGAGGPINWNSVTDLEFHPLNTMIIYASTLSQGIYISKQGIEWLHLGTPEYDVYAIATSSLYAATEGGLLQLTGTGVIAGIVKDAYSQEVINSATIFTDTGSKSITINGEYIMIARPAYCSVTVIADNYANNTEVDLYVSGSDVTWVDISMQKGIPDTSVGFEQDITRTTGAGQYCFITTAAND